MGIADWLREIPLVDDVVELAEIAAELIPIAATEGVDAGDYSELRDGMYWTVGEDGMTTRERLLTERSLLVCGPGLVAAPALPDEEKKDPRPAEERLAELLIAKPEEMRALQQIRQHILGIRLGPPDVNGKKCLRDLADEVRRLEFGIREATDHLTAREFNALRKENPRKARSVAEDVMEEVEKHQERFGEKIHPVTDCKARD